MILENSCCGLNHESPHSEINMINIRNTNIPQITTVQMIMDLFQVQTNRLPVTKVYNTFDTNPKNTCRGHKDETVP